MRVVSWVVAAIQLIGKTHTFLPSSDICQFMKGRRIFSFLVRKTRLFRVKYNSFLKTFAAVGFTFPLEKHNIDCRGKLKQCRWHKIKLHIATVENCMSAARIQMKFLLSLLSENRLFRSLIQRICPELVTLELIYRKALVRAWFTYKLMERIINQLLVCQHSICDQASVYAFTVSAR